MNTEKLTDQWRIFQYPHWNNNIWIQLFTTEIQRRLGNSALEQYAGSWGLAPAFMAGEWEQVKNNFIEGLPGN